MKINRLSLLNFGVFSGQNVLDLNSEKPIILIGGMNGRGKTTILEAVLFALYGRRSFAFEESGLTFPKYLKQRINTTDGNTVAKVALDLSVWEENKAQIYTIQREWRLSTQTPSVKTIASKNGIHDKMLSDNWDFFIEEMLPSAIAPFFFFDGEKISELANSDEDTYIKDSIKALLGINVVETAIDDVQRVIKKYQKNAGYASDLHEIAEYQAKLIDADKKLKAAKEESGGFDARRIQLEDKLKKAENRFAAMGGNLAANRKKMLEKQVQLNEKLVQINASLLDTVAGDLPLLIVLPLLDSIFDVATIEKEQKGIQSALEQMPSLLRSYEEKNHTALNIDDFIGYVKNITREASPVYNLTDSGYLRLQALCSTLRDEQQKRITEILASRNETVAKKTDTENYLAININEDEANAIYKEIVQLASDLATVTEQLRFARTSEASLSTQYDELKRQQTRVIESAVSSLESTDDIKRILLYSGYTIDIFQEYRMRFQSQKTKKLASTMGECFNKLIAKRSLLKEIKIDEATLQFHYYNDGDEEIDHSSFSAGEKQLLVIAMLWALGMCSKKQFPVIVDTPLARLDSVHREALVANYFPNVSEQTLLLSTDEEIYGKLYQMLSPNIGKEYTLQYDDKTKKSIIQTGYFGGKMQ